MKNLILLLLLCLTDFSSQAQTSLDSFYQVGTSWTWYDYVNYAFSRGNTNVYVEYISGDTTVNGKQYKVIKQYKKGSIYHDHGAQTITRYDSSQKKLLGGIRIDGEKVFFINLSTDTNKTMSLPPMSEKILYDFDLKVGDIISWKPFMNKVIDIDSIMLSNGKYEKRYHFEKTNYKDFWIRGVGSSLAFLESYNDYPFMYYWMQKTHAVCYNGSAYYKYYESANLDSSVVDHCYLIFPLSINETSHEVANKLYPNPVSGSFFKLVLTESVEDVYMYDAVGKLVNKTGALDKGVHEIKAPVASGVYILTIKDVRGKLSYARLEKL